MFISFLDKLTPPCQVKNVLILSNKRSVIGRLDFISCHAAENHLTSPETYLYINVHLK